MTQRTESKRPFLTNMDTFTPWYGFKGTRTGNQAPCLSGKKKKHKNQTLQNPSKGANRPKPRLLPCPPSSQPKTNTKPRPSAPIRADGLRLRLGFQPRRISEAPLATSVPWRPMATPIRASFSAGASFTPSPVLGSRHGHDDDSQRSKGERRGGVGVLGHWA